MIRNIEYIVRVVGDLQSIVRASTDADRPTYRQPGPGAFDLYRDLLVDEELMAVIKQATPMDREQVRVVC